MVVLLVCRDKAGVAFRGAMPIALTTPGCESMVPIRKEMDGAALRAQGVAGHERRRLWRRLAARGW